MTTEKLTTASVLAFERKLDPSDGLFYAGNWGNIKENNKWQPLIVREKAVRGTVSNRLKNKLKDDPAKLDAEIQKANLQRVDVVTLPNDCDTLKLQFTLKVLSGVLEPSVCNNAAYQKKFQETLQEYVLKNGFNELARRYACNLVNGRFLWRNRLGAEEIQIHISHWKNQEVAGAWVLNAFDFSLRDFNGDSNSTAINEIGALIADGLSGKGYVLFEVIAFARIGKGQEVYPSQELELDSGNSKKGKKSKVLYKIDEKAAMHSQKIGNALRTIDTWHPEADEIGAIAVEPYGSVTSRGKAYRPGNDVNFYGLLDDWILRNKTPALDNQHYVVANLIRGGVFGESGKE